MTKEEIDELPLYWAYLQMGAISSDKIGLKLSDRDHAEWWAEKQRRKGK